jgi:hypothetical protein
VSVNGPSVTIKSHHNVGGLPARMQLQIVEPLRFLFKDEVRRVGLSLGIPAQLIGRHPFPGPGLAIRVIGAVSGFFFALLLISFVSQFFLLLPSKAIAKLYGPHGARYGTVLKQFVPKVVDSALAPVRLIVNRK